MGNPNTGRVQHDVTVKPNSFRKTELRDILDQLEEMFHGVGYVDYSRTSGLVTGCTRFFDLAKTKKSMEATYNRTAVFLDSVVAIVYDTDGATQKAQVTYAYTRDVNKRVTNTTVQVVRL